METESDMENIAKTFFKVNGDNYVALVQYLREGGRSAEHHHTLEESIAQLAGRSYVELRPIEDDTNYRIVELTQGDILRIPPNNLHFVGTIEGGSLTIPIKQTLESRKDHLYVAKSDGRISQEIERLLREGYSSGNEAISTLHGYYERLRSGKEKTSAMRIIDERSHKDDNPNIRKILREFSADYI
jgi:quercetin dioxygenase-like cupin family protein